MQQTSASLNQCVCGDLLAWGVTVLDNSLASGVVLVNWGELLDRLKVAVYIHVETCRISIGIRISSRLIPTPNINRITYGGGVIGGRALYLVGRNATWGGGNQLAA